MTYTHAQAQKIQSAIKDRLYAEGFNVDAFPRVRCTGCAPYVINGVACHELRCPNQKFECKGCDNLVPRGNTYCADCQ